MLDKTKAALVAIDFQDGLLPSIPVGQTIVPQAVKLIRCCRELGLPVLWTEQYPKGLGRTTKSVANALEGMTPIEKVAFGCFGCQEFEESAGALGRSQLVVTGIESHVCVMQTVLRALEMGYSCFVAADATGSRAKTDHRAGLARMQAHGAELVTVEMVIFELLGAAGTPEFKRLLPLIK
jgi:nicotinamidase-related amidase